MVVPCYNEEKRKEFAEIAFKECLHTDWCFDIELLQRLQKHYNDKSSVVSKVVEFPLNTWVDVEGSKIKLHHFYNITKDLLFLFKGRRW